ncbi:hypothetical protein BD408DRAFT_423445 [Parasitella parasitica]|nr:hypothetical protein BD408DRAFT_423445 [Parasitella parasitica]
MPLRYIANDIFTYICIFYAAFVLLFGTVHIMCMQHSASLAPKSLLSFGRATSTPHIKYNTMKSESLVQ